MTVGPLFDDLWFFRSLRSIMAQHEGKLTDPFGQNPWIYRCVMSHATNISALPLLLKSGTRKESEIVEEHELVDLLAAPNPMMSGEQFWQGTIISLDLDGEAFWIKESRSERRVRPGEVPKELWLVPPGCMKEKVDQRGHLIGWGFRVGNREIPYMPHEVVHVRFVNPRNPHRGLAPLSAARLEAEVDHVSASFNRSFFENGAEVGVVLSTDQNLTRKQRDREIEVFEARHKGPANRNRAVLLAKGVTLQRNTATHKDMDYTEGRKWSRGVILAVFNVPPTEVGIYDDVSRDKATVARKLYWENVLRPMANFLASGATRGLLAGNDDLKADHWFEWDFSGVDALKEGERERAEIASIYFQRMGIPLDVLNEKFDLGLPVDRIPHATQSFLPAGLLPVEDVMDPPMLPEEEEEDPSPPAGESAAAAVPAKTRDTVRDQKFWRGFESKVLRPSENAWKARFKSIFHRVRIDVLRAFDKLAGDREKSAGAAGGIVRTPLGAGDVEVLLAARRKWEAEIAKKSKSLYSATVRAAADSIEAELGGFDAFLGAQDPAVLDVVARRIPRLAEGVTSSIAKAVRSDVLRGLAENETVAQLRKRLVERFRGSPARALAIARTETATAVNTVRFEAFSKEGVEKHRWVTSGDQHVRHEHAKVNGEEVVVGTFFSNGLRHPNDVENDPDGSNTINCRCVTVSAD